MATTSLNRQSVTVDSSLDNVTIIKYIDGYDGGRSLDVTGFTPVQITAGHVIIRSTTTGDFKPFPLNVGGTDYGTIPANHTIVGVAYRSVLTTESMVSIMFNGRVNTVTAPFPYTTAMQTALPDIKFYSNKKL